MIYSLHGKVAIVTGSAQGIGRQIALTLAERGASVVVNYPKSEKSVNARHAVQTILSKGGRAIDVCADVTRIADIEMLFAATIEAFGGVDIVVSNAGNPAAIKPMAGVTEAEYDAATALNAKGNFFVLREAARTMRDDGRIVVIASSATAMPLAGTAMYAGAKGAAELYVRVLAREIGARGITVNAVSPGPTETDTSRNADNLEARLAMAAQMTPLRRLGTPQDIADVVAFVSSEEARWITGQNLRVGGGLV